MYQDVLNIFDYLPVRSDDDNGEYIEHLWQAFLSLESTTPSAQPFSMMPFHLLFMLAVQYKVLRIYKELPREYELASILIRDDIHKDLLKPQVPKTIALLGESEIVHFLRIADLSRSEAKGIVTSTIRYRNKKIAHATVNIESDPIIKIKEYLRNLEVVQRAFLKINRSMADDWLNRVQSSDENIGDLLDIHFQRSLHCQRDLVDIVRAFKASRKLTLTQYNQALQKLHDSTIDKSSDYRRFSYPQI